MFWLTLPLAVIALSLAEYWIHRWQMHQPGWLNWPLPDTYRRHTYFHHGRFFKVFNDEPDEVGRDYGVLLSYTTAFLVLVAPLGALGDLVSWDAAGAVFVVVFAHHLVWNCIHVEMHAPQGRFFSRWRPYKALCRNHYLHHKHVNTNFCIVFLGWDHVFGTVATPTPAEIAEMTRMGYY